MRFLSLLHSRAALLRFELAREKKRCVVVLVLALFLMLAALLGFLFGALFLVFYFWESRLFILFSLTLFFFALAFLCALFLPRFLSSTFFSDSLTELEKDVALLKKKL